MRQNIEIYVRLFCLQFLIDAFTYLIQYVLQAYWGVRMLDYNVFVQKLISDQFCPGFDESFYKSKYGAKIQKGANPLEHYLHIGWKSNFDPSAGFSGAAYLAANTDVYDKGINPLVHYLLFGMKEGRSVVASEKRKKALAAHLEAGKSPPFDR